MASSRQSAPKFTAGRRRTWRSLRHLLRSPAASRSTARAFLIYYTSTIAVMAGAWFGHDFLPRHEYEGFTGFAVTQPPQTLLGCFANWDGVWYRDIADHGYTYDAREGSYVVFFPGYPCLAGLVSRLASLDTTLSLLLVSHASFFCCICLLEKYLKARFPDLGSGPVLLTLLAFAFSPMSFFFRMAYAESLFCLLLLLMLYGVNRGWPICGLAAIAGAATAVRLVGLALLPVLAMHLWASRSSTDWRHWIRWLALPFGAWGALMYMSYLAIDFGDPFVFQSNQVFFNNPPRATDSLPLRCWRLMILEPIWSNYLPESPLYWSKAFDQTNPLFSLQFMNPIFFLATVALVAYGSWAKHLNRYELVSSALLLLIPYISKGYDNGMLGHARYALVVVPVFWVFGRLLHETPREVQFCIIAVSAAYMTLFAMLFAAWRVII